MIWSEQFFWVTWSTRSVSLAGLHWLMLVICCESVFLAGEKNPSYLLMFAPTVLKKEKKEKEKWNENIKKGRFFHEIELKFSQKSLTVLAQWMQSLCETECRVRKLIRQCWQTGRDSASSASVPLKNPQGGKPELKFEFMWSTSFFF